jgi:hypothetical protein
MRLIKTITLQMLEDRGWLKIRANMVDHEGNTAKGKLVPLMKLTDEQIKQFNGK